MLLVVALAYPLAGGWLAARAVARQAAARLGMPVLVEGARAGFGGVRFAEIQIGVTGAATPWLRAAGVRASFGVLTGGGQVSVDRLTIELRPEHEAGLRAARARLGGRSGEAGPEPRASAGRRTVVTVASGSVRAHGQSGHTLLIDGMRLRLEPGVRASVHLDRALAVLRVRGGDADPALGAESLDIEAPLATGLRPAALPTVSVRNGAVRVLPTLPLTGIAGTVGPGAGAHGGDWLAAPIAIDLRGSYAGARERLWDARGTVTLGDTLASSSGALALRAERFTLNRISDVLPASVLAPEQASVDASLDLKLASGRVAVSGVLDVSGLSLRHPAVSADPVQELSMSVRLAAELDPERRRVDIDVLEGRIRDLVVQLSGFAELAPGHYTFADGNQLPFLPKVDLRLVVPRMSCAKLLPSLPSAVIPHLDGFVLRGFFAADLRTRVDYEHLDELELSGKVGIDGCTVVSPPPEVAALVAGGSVSQIVEVPPGPRSTTGQPETMAFLVGPDNPNFVPFHEISPHLVNAILTTEDSGFWKHHGFARSEFRTALQRNLERGGFRLGASSITMQMVKNLLLSQEKTLSRKFQELFLVWYLEQVLPKPRILELYFNAIEFGPRIYGIGPAARHYFGKSAADLTPMEATFFSSILPSPKRRYVQYCHGALSSQWDKYLHRILARMHERGRLTDEELAAATAQPFAFDTSARGMSETECLAWVKAITTRPASDPEPVSEDDLATATR